MNAHDNKLTSSQLKSHHINNTVVSSHAAVMANQSIQDFNTKVARDGAANVSIISVSIRDWLTHSGDIKLQRLLAMNG